MSNPFYSAEDEVDDDEFLRHPKNGTGGYMLPQHSSGSTGGGASAREASGFGYQPPQPPTAEQMRQNVLQKKREIEERTIESSQRSLGLIYESERVGQATAGDLARQKEQLKGTEARLDGINSQLKQSERHITGIKSVFGGIGNWWRGKGSSAATTGAGATGTTSTSTASYSGSVASSSTSGLDYGDSQRLDQMRRDNHPGLRGAAGASASKGSVDDVLDNHLDEMALGLGRLKGLATDLNKELDEHNEILDRLDDKTSATQLRVAKTNKDIGKLLKK